MEITPPFSSTVAPLVSSVSSCLISKLMGFLRFVMKLESSTLNLLSSQNFPFLNLNMALVEGKKQLSL